MNVPLQSNQPFVAAKAFRRDGYNLSPEAESVPGFRAIYHSICTRIEQKELATPKLFRTVNDHRIKRGLRRAIKQKGLSQRAFVQKINKHWLFMLPGLFLSTVTLCWQLNVDHAVKAHYGIHPALLTAYVLELETSLDDLLHLGTLPENAST
jgi:hypothetical protein